MGTRKKSCKNGEFRVRNVYNYEFPPGPRPGRAFVSERLRPQKRPRSLTIGTDKQAAIMSGRRAGTQPEKKTGARK